MTFKNLLDNESYNSLKKIKPLDLATILDENRITNSTLPLAGDLFYNWAAMPIGKEHLKAFQQMATELQLVEKYRALLGGEVMNTSEKRLVLHHLVRGRVLGEKSEVFADEEEKGQFYQQQLNNIKQFSDAVRNKEIVGSTNKSFTTVVQIGIGGSDLGPRALYLALENWALNENIEILKSKFISNVDPDDAALIFNDLDFERTLFILVTKSGTTQETLTNYEMVKKAIVDSKIEGLDPSKHMVAVTSKTSPLASSTDFLRAFYIDDHIGGRYSSTSAVGATILSLAYGYDVFSQINQGAHLADVASLEEDITKNGALLDALIGVYLRNVLEYDSTAILPYSQALIRFTAHLQQLDMESNGKHVNRDQQPIDYATGPIIFGEPGTNGQHSFYQLLHQGSDIIPLQFIGFKKAQNSLDIVTANSTSQQKLVANLIAQIVAFARGKDDPDKNKQFKGNRPSSLIFGDRLTPKTLGALLAHYENKVMFQGFIWNINSFDQEGVQLGKLLADKVLSGSEDDEFLSAYIKLLS